MISHSEQGISPLNKILLHACCGPCSLEPTRVLREDGWEPTLFYANPNIHPEGEYALRLDTIRTWAGDEGLEFAEGDYEPADWEATAGVVGEKLRGEFGVAIEPQLLERARELVAEGALDAESLGGVAPCEGEAARLREARCRACYRVRFEAAAAYAQEQGFEVLGSTLSVSPYQYTDIIFEELTRAADAAGLSARLDDWRPYYREATRRSKDAGMYRQNFCGCRFSAEEAEVERAIRGADRALTKRRKAEARAAADEQRREERDRKKAYADERARRHALLKEMRAENIRSDVVVDGVPASVATPSTNTDLEDSHENR